MYDKHTHGRPSRLKAIYSRRKNEIKSEILDLLLTNAPEEMTREAIMSILASKGIKCAEGTFYNAISKLKKQNLVISRRSPQAFYRFNRGKNEILRMGGRDPSIVSRSGFVGSVLELAKANGFEEICRVHDIHLKTNFWETDRFKENVSRCPNVWYRESRFRWTKNKRSNSWKIQLFVGYAYRVTFQVYEHGVLCSVVKCIKKPIPAKLKGLRALEDVLNEACLIIFGARKFWPFPAIDNWVVTFWHYGKDSNRSFDCGFNVTFKDFFGGLARIYVRNEDGRLRIEDFQSPRKTLGVLKNEKLQEEQIETQRKMQTSRLDDQKNEEEIRKFFSSPAGASMVGSMVASIINAETNKLIDFDSVSDDGGDKGKVA